MGLRSYAQTMPAGAGGVGSLSSTGSTGSILMDTYSSGCGSESQKVAKSIEDFRTMISKIKNTEACEAVKKTLEQNVPNIQDIQQVTRAQSNLRAIRNYEKELRDIENSLSTLLSSPSGATMGKVSDLNSRKQHIQLQLNQLKSQAGQDKTAQEVNTHQRPPNQQKILL